MPQHLLRAAVVSIALLVPAVASAQDAPTSPPVVGLAVKAAPLYATLSQGPYHWVSRKGAIVGGASFDINRHRRFALVAEALYTRKGAANLGGRAVLNMLEFPTLLRIGLASPARNVSLYGLAGHALDINLRTAQQARSRINLIDSNAVVGVGLEISRFVFEARESIGLRELAPNTPNLKAQTFSVAFGYRIR